MRSAEPSVLHARNFPPALTPLDALLLRLHFSLSESVNEGGGVLLVFLVILKSKLKMKHPTIQGAGNDVSTKPASIHPDAARELKLMPDCGCDLPEAQKTGLKFVRS